jgi:uncharacterized repeat protein (TIGR04138 family)
MVGFQGIFLPSGSPPVLTRAGRLPSFRGSKPMQKLDFSEAVALLADSDPSYHRDAYFFLREALDFTVKLRKRQAGGNGHVTGAQLCEGIRQLALKSFGPMVPVVFDYWGVRRTDDFGEMVWNLIELGVFGKTETDSKEDFRGVYCFREAFVAPYEPTSAAQEVAPLTSRAEIKS